jgi:hypothetical protein
MAQDIDIKKLDVISSPAFMPIMGKLMKKLIWEIEA